MTDTNTPDTFDPVQDARLYFLDRDAWKREQRRRKSDAEAISLINLRLSSAIRVVDSNFAEKQPLHLEVTLNNDRDYGVYLSFKIGSSKMYVVKNLPELQDCLVSPGTIKLGSKSELWVEYDAFDEESRPLVDFFLTHYYETTINQRQSYYGFSATPKKMMPVTMVHLDELFASLPGGSITVKSRSFNRTCQVVTTAPRLSLQLTRTEHGAILTAEGVDDVYRGSRQAYVFSGDRVHICDETFRNTCADLLSAIAIAPFQELFFHESDIPTLFNAVLRGVDSVIPITIVGDFEDCTPPPLSTDIYFDVDKTGSVTARMIFSYGDESHAAYTETTPGSMLDLLGEAFAEEMLAHYMVDSSYQHEVLVFGGDESDLFTLAGEGIDRLSQIAELYMSEDFLRIRVRPPVIANIGVKLNGRLLDIDFDIDEIDFEDLAAALASYRQSKRYVRLRDGSFLALQEGAIPEIAELLEGLDLDDQVLSGGQVQVESNRALYLDGLLKRSGSVSYSRDEAMRRIARMMQEVADAPYQVPAVLDGVLRDYQQVGYRWLRTLEDLGFGGILADDMGLGKTLMVLAMIDAKREEREERAREAKAAGAAASASTRLPSLVVCPASLVLNWHSEATRFTPDLKVLPLIGSAKERRQVLAEADLCDIIVTSYDQFKRNVRDFEHLHFDLVILDEAQMIKNQNTQAAKAVKQLNANTRLALTGTPIENSLAELWSIFDFIMPGYLQSYRRFKSNYETPIIRHSDLAKIDRLRTLVRPFILRRLKSDVLRELPDKIEKVLAVPLGEEQQNLYLGTLAQVKRELAERLAEITGPQGRIAALAALTRMRQICCDPSLIFENYQGESAKREACLELIESCVESGNRMLLFSQFTSMLDILQNELDNRGISYLRLDGSTPKTTRQHLVDRFNSDTTSVFLISLRAGGTGLNLTGADVVIHYDPWWNLSVQNQATDRTHRIGQQKIVQVFKLIAQSTVEERIMALQEQKADLANEIILEGGNAFDTLTSEELMALFEDE